MFDNLKYLLGVPKGSAPGCLVGRDLPGGPDWMGDFVRALVGFGDSLGVCVGVELPPQEYAVIYIVKAFFSRR